MNKFKKKVTMFTTMLAFLTVSCAAVNAAPMTGDDIAGKIGGFSAGGVSPASVSISGNTVLGQTANMSIHTQTHGNTPTMHVNLTSNKAGDIGQVDWKNFNVGKGERVDFGFSNVSQTSINRVLGGQESKIMGQLTNSCTTGSCAANAASSKVILINPAGVMFGAGSQVDLNSFTVSTFDIKGAQNIHQISDAAEVASGFGEGGKVKVIGAESLQAKSVNGNTIYETVGQDHQYKANVLNKFSPYGSTPAGKNQAEYTTNGTGISNGAITFDSNETQAFKDAGINMDNLKGKTNIELNGTTFAHFDRDANGNLTDKFSEVNTNKTVNIVSDNVKYTDSIIKTGGNYNHEAYGTGYSQSNVRIVTADGVTFQYMNTGYAAGNEQITSDGNPDPARTIAINNSGLSKDTVGIESGDVRIANTSANIGSKTTVKETFVKGTKLLTTQVNGSEVAGETGTIEITSANGLDIDHSRIESVNTELNGKSTVAQSGGNIYLESSNGNVNINDSLVKSAAIDHEVDNASGDVYVGGANVNIEGTRILSQEKTYIEGSDVSLKGSLVNAKNDITGKTKDVEVYSNQNINIENSAVAGHDIDLNSANVKIASSSDSTNYASGDVLNGQNKSLLKADNNININANNTEINNSSLAYDNLNLINDVTVKGNVTLTPESGKDLNIQTNGNLTFDNANVMYGDKAEINVSSTDSGNIDSIPYQVNIKGSTADSITAKSTNKNLKVQNNSNLNANNDINLAADKGSVSVDKSSVNAGNDVNVNAKTSSNIDNSNVTAGKDVNVNAETSTIANNSQVNGKNINVKTTKSSNIDSSKLTATNNIDVNAGTTSNVTNSTLDAGNDATIASVGKNTIDNSTVNARTGNAKVSASNGDVEIVNKSTIEAGNDVTAEGNNVKVANSNITAGSDSEGFDITKDAKDNIGDVNINAKTGNVNINDSKIQSQDNDVNVKSAKATNVDKSTLTATNNIDVNAGTTSNVTNSTLDAGNDATIASVGKNTIDNSTVNARTGNAKVTSEADTSLTNSTVEAANDATVKGKNANVTKSNVIAGSDSEGFDKVNDANDTIGDANIIASDGSVHITDGSTIESQDHDVNIVSKDTIAFGTGKNITPDVKIKGHDNVKINSTDGDITAEKTDMGDIEYGDRLIFEATKGDNIITSADSLKSVNVDYIAGGANRIYTTDDAQFVNNTFTAPDNFVESGDDVILNNVKINTPDGMQPKDVTTQIYANGNVTTANVTGEDLEAKGGIFPQSTEFEGDVTDPSYRSSQTTLDLGQTKLKVETQTVKDSSNPTDGSIVLNVKNADNPEAGVDLVAKNVDELKTDSTDGYLEEGYFKSGDSKWDENIDPKEGPEVHLNAEDDKVSIANIETDKLTLDPNDTITADKTVDNPTIEVKDQGGFNLDPELEYTKDGDDKISQNGDFRYDETIEKKVTDEGGDLEWQDWSGWEPTGREWTDSDGTKHVEYENTRDGRITDRIITSDETKHKITFDNNPEGEFTLIYHKQDVEKIEGRPVTAEQVKEDTSIIENIINPEDNKPVQPSDFIDTKVITEECPEPPVPVYADSLADRLTLPREITETSKTSKITDNTVDQSENVMSAAAKVDIADDNENPFDDEADEEIEE